MSAGVRDGADRDGRELILAPLLELRDNVGTVGWQRRSGSVGRVQGDHSWRGDGHARDDGWGVAVERRSAGRVVDVGLECFSTEWMIKQSSLGRRRAEAGAELLPRLVVASTRDRRRRGSPFTVAVLWRFHRRSPMDLHLLSNSIASRDIRPAPCRRLALTSYTSSPRCRLHFKI
jgi:hypothetical protein